MQFAADASVREKELESRIIAIRRKFIASFSGRVAELSTALEQLDWSTVGDLGHKLKGTTACLGFDDMSRIGQEIQEAAAAQSVDLAVGCVRRLNELYEAAAKD